MLNRCNLLLAYYSNRSLHGGGDNSGGGHQVELLLWRLGADMSECQGIESDQENRKGFYSNVDDSPF